MVWAGLVACFLLPGASHSLGSQYPEPLRNKAEIAKAPAETDDIDIRDLPIEAFSDLKKFPQLKRVRFGNREGKGATDAKLEALANLALTNVFDVNLLNCPNVTDNGIRALAKMKSIKLLGLEGTSISDESVKIISTEMNVTGLNVANCSKVTFAGLKELSQAKSFKSLGFSADNLTESQVLELLSLLPASLKELIVVDPAQKLDKDHVKTSAKERGIKVLVRNTGALQDMLNRGATTRRP